MSFTTSRSSSVDVSTTTTTGDAAAADASTSPLTPSSAAAAASSTRRDSTLTPSSVASSSPSSSPPATNTIPINANLVLPRDQIQLMLQHQQQALGRLRTSTTSFVSFAEFSSRSYDALMNLHAQRISRLAKLRENMTDIFIRVRKIRMELYERTQGPNTWREDEEEEFKEIEALRMTLKEEAEAATLAATVTAASSSSSSSIAASPSAAASSASSATSLLPPFVFVASPISSSIDPTIFASDHVLTRPMTITNSVAGGAPSTSTILPPTVSALPIEWPIRNG